MSYKTFTKEKQSDVQFLKEVGMKPHHKILDIGCGGGRLGYELIDYLDKGNYYGFDKEKNWIESFRLAVTINNLSSKKPTILLSGFDWDLKSNIELDYVYAYSVFTHVELSLAKECLKNLRPYLSSTSEFYATLLVGEEDYKMGPVHTQRPNEYAYIHYSLDFFDKMLKECGYYLDDIEAPEQLIGPTNASVNGDLRHRMILIKRKEE